MGKGSKLCGIKMHVLAWGRILSGACVYARPKSTVALTCMSEGQGCVHEQGTFDAKRAQPAAIYGPPCTRQDRVSVCVCAVLWSASLTCSNLPQHSSQDLATACLGQCRGPVDHVWYSEGADGVTHVVEKNL